MASIDHAGGSVFRGLTDSVVNRWEGALMRRLFFALLLLGNLLVLRPNDVLAFPHPSVPGEALSQSILS